MSASATPDQVVSSLGKPAKVYQVDGYSVMVYSYNLLTRGRIPVPPPGD
jgi:hypothetical protein